MSSKSKLSVLNKNRTTLYKVYTFCLVKGIDLVTIVNWHFNL